VLKDALGGWFESVCSVELSFSGVSNVCVAMYCNDGVMRIEAFFVFYNTSWSNDSNISVVTVPGMQFSISWLSA
jgi:hypothetical protein